MYIKEIHTTELDQWISEYHYLHSCPAGSVIRLEIQDDSGKRIGGMLWGRNPSPKQDQKRVLCLTRMYCIDEAGPNTESHALSMARKYIRKHYPHIKGLVAYSSTGEGHEGVIYQADGWFEVSRSAGGKDCRPGRANRDTSVKIKWCRTP